MSWVGGSVCGVDGSVVWVGTEPSVSSLVGTTTCRGDTGDLTLLTPLEASGDRGLCTPDDGVPPGTFLGVASYRFVSADPRLAACVSTLSFRGPSASSGPKDACEMLRLWLGCLRTVSCETSKLWSGWSMSVARAACSRAATVLEASVVGG